MPRWYYYSEKDAADGGKLWLPKHLRSHLLWASVSNQTQLSLLARMYIYIVSLSTASTYVQLQFFMHW